MEYESVTQKASLSVEYCWMLNNFNRIAFRGTQGWKLLATETPTIHSNHRVLSRRAEEQTLRNKFVALQPLSTHSSLFTILLWHLFLTSIFISSPSHFVLKTLRSLPAPPSPHLESLMEHFRFRYFGGMLKCAHAALTVNLWNFTRRKLKYWRN
jgi:hypothetical protein